MPNLGMNSLTIFPSFDSLATHAPWLPSELMWRKKKTASSTSLLPSGKRLHKKYGRNPHFQLENPLFQWQFSIAMLNHRRVIYSNNFEISIYPSGVYSSYFRQDTIAVVLIPQTSPTMMPGEIKGWTPFDLSTDCPRWLDETRFHPKLG